MNRYQVACPGCSKQMHSTNKEDLRDVLHRHIRNCVPIRKAAALVLAAKRLKRRRILIGLVLFVVATALSCLAWSLGH